MRARSDRGQLAPLYAVIVLVAAGSMVLLVHLGVLALHRAQARSAADAAALAGAAEGHDAADDVAQRNGAVLESFITFGTDVEVRVRVGSTHATARARRDDGCRSSAQSDPVHSVLCHPISPG
jgi:uncharacterized membrane protein